MDVLQGKKLIMKNCQSYKAYYYLRKTKIIIYYFSASWVDDVGLLRKLKEIYAENVKRGIGMEVIYVSSDTDEKQFSKYFREHHGPWPSIPSKNVELAEELRYRYNITCLPQIVVIRKEDGFIITRRGKEELEKSGINVLVAWSDYEPNLILIDDTLIDLIEQTNSEDASEYGKPYKSVAEPSEEREEEDDTDSELIQNKVLSFAANRYHQGNGKV